MEEKKVPGFEEYTAYSDGRIMGRRGRFLNPKNGRYLKVRLCGHSQRKWRPVHRVVGECFVANPLNKNEINHIDGNKHNNKSSNLEWVTHSENHLHAYRIGIKMPSGRKVSDEGAALIRRLKGIVKIKDLAKEYGVATSTIVAIQQGSLYREVSHV